MRRRVTGTELEADGDDSVGDVTGVVADIGEPGRWAATRERMIMPGASSSSDEGLESAPWLSDEAEESWVPMTSASSSVPVASGGG